MLALAVSALSAKESADITVFRPAVNPRNKKDVMVKAKTRYEKETGGKVTFVLSDWGNWQSKILTYMAAGNPIDVTFARSADFPKFYTKGYLEPIDGYVNLKTDYMNIPGMDASFKYDGHYYAASHKLSNHYWIVIYNKTLMEEEGIAEKDQPYALWQRGEWDWNHLRSLAQKLTKDTTGSGTIDRWGFANWYTAGLIYANGATLTNIDSNANITLNFEDQRVTEALSFLEQAKKDGWYLQDNNIAKDGIPNRTVAMMMEREYYPSSLLANTRDELCYVPVPFGPSNKEKKNIFECDGYAIGAGSDSPTYAGKFINICLEEWTADDKANRAKTWPEEIFTLGDTMEKDAWYPGYTESPIESIINSFLGEIVWSGNSPASAIAAWTPKAVALVADANKPMGKLEKLPFKKIEMDFKKKKQAEAFRMMPGTDYSSVAVSWVDGAEAIDKGSLKISMDYEKDGADITGAITDADKLAIVGWREYVIEFDVKALKAPGEGAYVWVQAYQDELNKYGWTKKDVSSAGEVVHVSATVLDVLQNGKIPLQFGGHNMKDFVIDNLVITER